MLTKDGYMIRRSGQTTFTVQGMHKGGYIHLGVLRFPISQLGKRYRIKFEEVNDDMQK